MTQRIEDAFKKLRQNQQIALIPYIAAGYPDIETTYKLVISLAEHGADIIEIGVPFSDPLMDGPVIQKAYKEALQSGITLHKIIEMVKELRLKTDIPLVLMSSYNPIYKYGEQGFVLDALRAGVDGIIVPDLPPEEAGKLKDNADKKGLDTIFLIAPTSSQDRVRLICKYSTGFIYYVSVAGITGTREYMADKIKGSIKEIRLITNKPIGVGFGISKREHVQELAGFADAAIVGSAIVSIIQENKNSSDMIKNVCHFVSNLK